MAHIIRNEEQSPIYVSVFGAQVPKLQQLQQELSDFGYHLNFPNTPVNSAIKEHYSDIYMVDLPELEQSISALQANKLPFLVYGLDGLPKKESRLKLLYDAADYFVDTPSVDSIRLKVQLGLHRHRERQNHNNRVQKISEKIENNRLTGIATGLLISKTGLSPEEVFDKLKLVSRNKQRRVADVAKEIINILTSDPYGGRDIASNGSIENLVKWLDETIVFRKNR